MNPVSGLFRDMSEIAAALISVAFVGMLITNAKGTASVVQAVSSGFSGVLSTATFQRSGYLNPLAGLN